MIHVYKKVSFYLTAVLLTAALSACGGSSSDTTSFETTIPLTVTTVYAHNLVFRNSTTLSTGYNAFGQLGIGFLGARTIPGPLFSYYPFAGLATGGVHSVAFINNSTVRCWGYNGYGQLGNDSTIYSAVPVKALGISGVRAVAAGGHHTLALGRDDTLWAWGLNDAGQLGINKTALEAATSLVPQRISVATVTFSNTSTSTIPFRNISSVAANGKHSLALADGKVWAWGLNSSGQLGITSTAGEINVAPKEVEGLPAAVGGFSGIAAGGAFSYAVAKNGTLWAWGNNFNGQLGNNTFVGSFKPVQVVKGINDPLTGVKKAVAGVQHGMALLDNGEVWAWGYNHFGQIGRASAPDFQVAVQVPLPGKATEIRAFGSSSMARIDGAWYGWGDNSLGQLGTGVVGSVLVPQKMIGF